MKLIYVIAQSHTGSTLLDSILGQHPDFQSTGEFKHFSWQLFRTLNHKGTVEEGSACSCGEDFRDCTLWSAVIDKLSKTTGVDASKDPYMLNITFFNQKSYKNRGEQKRSVIDFFQSRLTRFLLELGFGYKFISYLVPSIKTWLPNTWNVYAILSKVSGRNYIVDSTKDRTLASLFKRYQPKDVHVVFLHRSVYGIAASSKRLAKKKGLDFDIHTVIKQKQDFEKAVRKYKRLIGKGTFTDIDYEDLVRFPSDFVNNLAQQVGSRKKIEMPNEAFFIEPNKLHIVAGNPMRYRGRQQVVFDDRWHSELTEKEKGQIERAFQGKS
ncbi:sulfotransferase [Flagellimonas marinaquae]